MANGGFLYYRVVGENGALQDRVLAVFDRQGNRPWELDGRQKSQPQARAVEGVAELPVDQGWCVTETSIPLEYLRSRCMPIPENEARRLGMHIFDFIDRSIPAPTHGRRKKLHSQI